MAGRSRPTKIPRIAKVTNNSTRENAFLLKITANNPPKKLHPTNYFRGTIYPSSKGYN
jgi:hypothetical protein